LQFAELGQGERVKKTRLILEALDFFFLSLFVAEILLKWMDNFSSFWKEGWNIFDFFITVLVKGQCYRNRI